MKKIKAFRLLLLILSLGIFFAAVCGSALAAEPASGGITKVNLITGQELEILYSQPVKSAAQAEELFTVYVDGKEADFAFLSYFDQGEYAEAPVINIRLKTPLVSGAHTYHTITDETAKRVEIQAKGQAVKVAADWVPYYTFTDQLVENGTKGERGNRGSRGLMWVWGNENSRCSDESTAHVPTAVPNRLNPTNPESHYTNFQNNYRSAQWVVSTYVTAAIDRTVGRSEQLVNAANTQGMRVVVVGNGQSVYTVPEYRHLYVSGVTKDWDSRVTISGSREIPIIVTTAEDVCRVKGENKTAFSDTSFLMLREFAKLFLELGVKDGWSKFVLGIYDDPDAYNCYKRLQENYAKSKAAKLWPGTNVLNSLEDYYVYGTLVYFEALPEAATWQKEAFPINTRRELLEYDLALYESMVEVYGEWEYFVGGGTGSSDVSRRWGAPWYKHNQVDNYTVVNGKIQPYAPLQVEEVNLISPSQVEVVFNREIKDLDELRTLQNWSLKWTPAKDNTIQIGEESYTFKAGTTYTFDAESSPALVMEYYMWKTLTLKVTGNKFNTGYMGSEIGGFTEEEIQKAFDSSLSVEEGYKPWFTEDAYYRDLNPIGTPFMGDLGDISGWQADIESERTFYAVSPKVYDAQTPEFIKEQKLVKAEPIPRSHFYGMPSALEKGEYVRFDAAKGGYVAYDKKNQPVNGGAVRIPVAVNGSLKLEFKGSPAVKDWAGNALPAKTYEVQLKPWNTQIMRSEKTGIYVYADAETQKNSLLVGLDYSYYMYSGGQDYLGQRIADGFNFFFYHKNVKTGEYGSAGLDILGYHNHMYMAPNRRSLYNAGPTVLYAEGLGYGICSSMEYSLLRDYPYTRYDHESIMHHEGVHSVEFPGMLYFTDLNFEGHQIWKQVKTDLWMDSNTYAGGSMAEWLATVSTYWFGTMRESVDGSITGVWTPFSTREELYAYDPLTYQFMKKIYYNGETYLDPNKVPGGSSAVPGWDEKGNSINDDIIKWGLSFPGTMNEDRADWGITNQFRWTSWGAPNQWDINTSFASGSGIRYGSGKTHPDYPERATYSINYNPYLKEYHYLNDDGSTTATRTNNVLRIGEVKKDFPAVKINDYNWLKLRDFAMLLKGGAKQFSISYDEATRTIDIRTKQGYLPVGDEMKSSLAAIERAVISSQSLRVDGETVNLRAYNIKGYNYFRLRDLATVLDFAVIYDEDTAEIYLDFSKPYKE
ncbi:MAG: hypothetical protein Q4B50_02880 [Bacillota bacterium]|nr:hypothetical protein [Bacillota bacterium]